MQIPDYEGKIEKESILHLSWGPILKTRAHGWKGGRRHIRIQFRSVSSVTQSCPTLCDPTDCSTPGFPVHHQLPELACKLMSIKLVMSSNHLNYCCSFSSCLQCFPASGSFPTTQFFASGGQRIGVSASALPMNIQDWFPLVLTGLISMQSKVLSRVFYNTAVQKHQFFDTQHSLWSNSHIHTWPLEKSRLWLDARLLAK